MAVVVTGIGVVSAIGNDVAENLSSLRAARSGMALPQRFATRLQVPVAEVKLSDEALRHRLHLPQSQATTRTSLLGMLAAKEAITDARLGATLRIGLVSSTSVGGMDRSEDFYPLYRQNHEKGRLRDIVGHDCAASTEQIADYLGITALATTISTACSSGGNAVIFGAELIEAGILDAVVVGGTDALCRFTMNGFHSLMILDKELCRPFDATRAGLNLGEGAGFLVLQSSETLNEGQTVYCHLAGYANSNDAYHQTASSPDGEGPYLSMKWALEKSGLSPSDIDYINVHGTGTDNNDLSESRALIRIFGEQVPDFSSVKAMIGHTLGAAEGIEAVYSVLALRHGIRFANLRFKTPIEDTALRPLTKVVEQPTRNVLSNAFGFGGNDATLIFERLEAKHIPADNTRADKQPIYLVAASSVASDTEAALRHNAIEPDYKTTIENPSLRRRMSRLIKMGVSAGLSCLKQADNPKIDAIITATGLGFLADTEKFLNNISDLDEQLLPPTAFIQSTFNTVGAQIALLIGNKCYNNTYVHRGISLESALLDASLRLNSGDTTVLVGAMDELTDTSFALQQRLPYFRGQALGEGAHFFLLSNKCPEQSTRIVLQAVELRRRIATDDELAAAIQTFLAKNGQTKCDVIFNGTRFDIADSIAFKQQHGDYPSASGEALHEAIDQLTANDNCSSALIVNSFDGLSFGLMLVKKQ